MARKSKPDSDSKPSKADRLGDYLRSRPASELAELLLRFAREHKRVRAELTELVTLQTADVDQLIKQARKEIRERTQEIVDDRTWDGDNIPDYSKLRSRFEALLKAGQFDALVDLGRELFDRGQQQVEEGNDEGQTHDAINECLQIPYQALAHSPRPPADKILWAIDLRNDDGFRLSKGVEKILEQDWPKEVWSAVADALAQRMTSKDAPEDYKPGDTVNDLANALDRAGRSDEVLPLFEAEVASTGGHARLVKRLIEARCFDDAERRALEGIASGDRYAGLKLCELLCQLARKRRDWPRVAAFEAEEFFEHANVEAFQKLMKAADKASCEAVVRAAALRFLQTGKKPSPPDWPLPEVPRPKPDPQRSGRQEKAGPDITTLLELAIAENRPDDVLLWYGRYQEKEKGNQWSAVDHYRRQVADAVAATYPDRALELYREVIEKLIASTSGSGYEAIQPHLERLRDLFVSLGRQGDWASYLTGLRRTHGRKRRLMDVLDRIHHATTAPKRP